jgi:hypothetical protein
MTEQLTTRDDQISRHDYWFPKVMEQAQSPKHRFHVLEKQHPERVVKILMMIEESASYREIAEGAKCNYTTISRIRHQYAETILERRKEFSRRFATVSEMASDLMMKKMEMLNDDDNELKKTPLKDLALAMAIATDKGSMMDGMPSQTIEVRRGASFEDALKFQEEARKRLESKSQVIEAEVVT